MGVDIHCFVEARWRDDDAGWQSVAQFDLPRDRDAFGRIAGIQGVEAVFPARGLPPGLGYSADKACHLWVADDMAEQQGWCSRAEAEKWIADGQTHWVAPNRILDPDFFGFTWLTLSEWSSAIEAPTPYRVGVEYLAVAGAMNELERGGYLSRVVIWFDA